ncbi:MAG: DUF2971 domain-containing protein [Verrucomicrobiales bacterium]|nr:DUF2971 domain-containing protein [Verrucomicrobiales bacterium]
MRSKGHLYRYRHINDPKYAIAEVNGNLWLSISTYLNDRFDGISDLPEPHKTTIHRTMGGVDVGIQGKERWMIACFSKKWNSMPMWAHYGKEGTGLCFEYNYGTLSSSILNHNNNPLKFDPKDSIFGKVKYRKRLPRRPTRKGILIKANSWKYEKEWRGAVLDRALDTQSKGKVISVKGGITSVIFGWRTPQASIDEITSVIRARNLKTKIEQVTINENTRRLERRDLVIA